MATKDPNAAAAKWQSRLSQAASDGTIAAGIDAVTVSPGQAAARSADLWATNTVAAKETFRTNAGKVTLADWQNAAKTKGVDRIAGGATAAQPKMAAVLGKLLPAINTIKGQLPPRGNFPQNMQRANQMAAGLHNQKGSFKA